jgi:YhcH/YjgK/YiaL family protein
MILGSLESWDLQAAYEHPVIAEAVEKLKDILASDPAAGRIELQGNMMYATVMEPETKLLQEQLAEKHETYIDLHYLIFGKETIGWLPEQEGISPVKAYSSEEDYALYTPTSDEVLLTLVPGMFAVFFPHDIHRPAMGSSRQVIKKIVIKIHTSLLKA